MDCNGNLMDENTALQKKEKQKSLTEDHIALNIYGNKR